MKDEIKGMIITEFFALRPKKYCYLTDDDKSVKKTKGTKKIVIKRIFKFNNYKNFLFKSGIILKLQQTFKSKQYCVYTEEVNKVALNSDDDKILQTFDRIRTYPYRKKNAFKVCKSEMLSKCKSLILIIIPMKIKQSIIQSGHIL